MQDIKLLHQKISFSSRTFIDYVTENASSIMRLLQVYYEVSERLDVLALPTKSLLSSITDLDEPLCELLMYHEDVAKGK